MQTAKAGFTMSYEKCMKQQIYTVYNIGKKLQAPGKWEEGELSCVQIVGLAAM